MCSEQTAGRATRYNASHLKKKKFNNCAHWWNFSYNVFTIYNILDCWLDRMTYFKKEGNYNVFFSLFSDLIYQTL